MEPACNQVYYVRQETEHCTWFAMEKYYCTAREVIALRAEVERLARRYEALHDETVQVVQSSLKLIEESRQLLNSLSNGDAD